MKKIYSLFLLLILALFALKINTYHEVEAASYDSYYANVDVSSGENLQKSLTTIISDGYNGISYSGLWDAYKTTDCKPGTNYIWDMYSNYNYVVGGSKQGANYSGEGDSYNREHSIPQSWFNEASPMKSDLFHVYPTDGYVNNMRGNYVFGETDNPTKTSGNGSKLGPSSNSLYNGTVFEPIDEYKGDFARTYFYMATRYRTLVGNWGGNATAVFKGSYPYLTNYSVDLFMKWHAEDPVSEKETSRNDAVYAIQKNRNPFIDHPEYANFIWGDGTLEVPGSTYTVSYECGDGITFDYTDTTEYESGDKVATPTVSPNRVGFEFIGWTIDEKTKVLWDFDANTISSNLTFYPVWEVSTVEAFISDCSKVSSQLLMNFETTELSTYTTIEGYSLVTDITELSINDNIIITDISSSYALSTTQNSNNRAVASISVTDSVITTVPSDVQVITLEAGTATNSFAFNVGNGYLYAASSGSNWLRTQTSIDDNASFKIEISSDGSAVVVAQGSNTRNHLLLNSGNNPKLFSCYAESKLTDSSFSKLCIYKMGGSAAPSISYEITDLAIKYNYYVSSDIYNGFSTDYDFGFVLNDEVVLDVLVEETSIDGKNLYKISLVIEDVTDYTIVYEASPILVSIIDTNDTTSVNQTVSYSANTLAEHYLNNYSGNNAIYNQYRTLLTVLLEG